MIGSVMNEQYSNYIMGVTCTIIELCNNEKCYPAKVTFVFICKGCEIRYQYSLYTTMGGSAKSQKACRLKTSEAKFAKKPATYHNSVIV